MGTIAVGRILDRASQKLLDVTQVRWKTPELLADYNAVKNLIVGLKPDSFVLTEPFEVQEGVSKYEIPPSAIAFRRLNCWQPDSGEPGPVVTLVDRDDLDVCRPSWRSEAGERVLHFVHDKKVPRIFYVYPSATGFVEGVWTATAPDATGVGDDVGLDDSYEDCIYRGIMAACLSKNFKSLDNSRVSYYEGRFNEFLGLKGQAQYRFAAKAAAQEQVAEMPGGDG